MKRGSLRRRFVPQMMAIMLLMVTLVIVYHVRVTDQLTERVTAENIRLSTIYAREIDTQLESIGAWLGARFFENDDLRIWLSADEAASPAAKQRLTDALREGAELYPIIEGAFIIPENAQTPLVVSGVNMEYEQFVTLQNSVDTIAEYGRAFTGTWSGVAVAPNWCSFCALVEIGGAKVGALVGPQALLQSMPFFTEDEHHFALAKHNGFVLLTNLPEGIDGNVDLTGDLDGCYRTGEGDGVIVCGAETKMGPFRLMMLTTDQELMRGLEWTRWVLWALIFAAVAATLGLVWRLRRSILMPLDKTMRAIEAFGEGEHPTPLAPRTEAREFREIYLAFNTMTDQIEHLRIANYEETIRKQKAELRFYQTQIRPHFILNCLTTINNLALSGQTEALTAYTQAFSGFARCMFRVDFAPVSVEDELRQVDFYIRMQSIRLKDRVFCECQTDEAAKTVKVPAMLIQTLVENCVKHGCDASGNVSIFVSCAVKDGTLTVTVEDAGEGFSEAALQAVNSGTASGFGLKNLRASLELMYGSRASLRAENVPGAGSRITVTAPQN